MSISHGNDSVDSENARRNSSNFDCVKLFCYQHKKWLQNLAIVVLTLFSIFLGIFVSYFYGAVCLFVCLTYIVAAIYDALRHPRSDPITIRSEGGNFSLISDDYNSHLASSTFTSAPNIHNQNGFNTNLTSIRNQQINPSAPEILTSYEENAQNRRNFLPETLPSYQEFLDKPPSYETLVTFKKLDVSQL